MCRDRTGGGRRCYHDGAEPRRNRRQNSNLKSKHMGSLITSPPLNTVSVEIKEGVSIHDAKALVQEYQALRDKCFIPNDENNHLHHGIPLTSGEIIAEKKLIELGTVITELSYEYGAPTNEEWGNYLSHKEELEASYLSKMNSILSGMLKVTGGRVAFGNNVVAPSKRDIEYTNDAGETVVSNEADFYMERAVAFSQDGNTDTALMLIDGMEKMGKLVKEQEANSPERDYNKLIERRSSAYRQALRAVGVEFAGTDTLAYYTNNSAVKPFISKSVSMYPKQWVDNSNTVGGLSVRVRAGRAFYRHSDKLVQMDTNSPASIVTHELAHRMEYTNPEIGVAERAFLSRRSGLLAYHQGEVSSLPSSANPANMNEPRYKGNFAHDYMGRVYDAGDTSRGTASYELLSMGMESVFYGKHGGGVGNDGTKPDIEYSNFIVGLLASTANNR